MASERRSKLPFGGWLIVMAVTLFVFERLTGQGLSVGLGRFACGETYLMPSGGNLTDMACGFDFDLYLSAFIFVLAFLGLCLLVMRLLRRNKTVHTS